MSKNEVSAVVKESNALLGKAMTILSSFKKDNFGEKFDQAVANRDELAIGRMILAQHDRVEMLKGNF